jgi:phenylalanyl-tRNA synthetase alpha chain
MDFDRIINELSKNEKRVLIILKKLNGKSSPKEVLEKGKFQQEVEVINASSWLQSKKLVNLEERVKKVYSLAYEGKLYLEKGLPEKRALKLIKDKNGKVTLKDLSDVLKNDEIPVAIGWLKKKNWVIIKKEDGETVLEITEKGLKSVEIEDEDQKILIYLNDNPNSEIDRDKIKSLLSRKNLINEKEIVTNTIFLTEKGKEIIQRGFEIKDEISQITSAVIKNGEWEKKDIRPYDINAFAPAKYGGKAHPLVNLIHNIRQIFLEMGFQEIKGDFVESCFWNMDVLFIPQDHPAREMQDTLYCKTPSKFDIEEKDLLKRIADVHENGGITSSIGWDYKFSKDEGKRTLLRTHTTVNTIRFLYNNPKPPSKIFSIGQVFRKENIDSTHLPEFYQIEGIVHEEKTNFRQLIGILKEFYMRMGFEQIRFRPAYFPYTEPSMEVDVLWNNEWMELGGSGIFRPEVTEPIGIKNPVLAWGLGLERLAMLKFGLTDIRDLHISDLNWLRNQSLI